MKPSTKNNFPDQVCLHVDSFMRTVFGRPHATERENPATGLKEPELTPAEAKNAAGLMRVNHTGEVCAQALYQGQALTARSADVRKQMQRSAEEENDHLLWCEKRLEELGSHTSFLNPFFYLSSFAIGATAGALGDKWSLGFLAETEKQVCQHLTNHLDKLPDDDHKSRLVVQQMREDEAKHESTANEAGAASLPISLRKTMRALSRVMTSVTYWV